MSLSTALHDARLQALQARIRPHFLFNSINAVLSIVRADPKRAETALEDMADLFRMAMADSQKMVPLRREIELSRQYLSLEKLRLGERLMENWSIDDTLNDAHDATADVAAAAGKCGISRHRALVGRRFARDQAAAHRQ